MPSPKLLSGDNPQIPKGYGEEPVRAYLDAVPGWKNAICRRIDAIVCEQVPGVRKAVKWNTPLYGPADPAHGDCWFLSFHCFTRYVKVSFFRGADLDPLPPEGSKVAGVRYLHLREGEEPGEAFASWVRQAAALPCTKM